VICTTGCKDTIWEASFFKRENIRTYLVTFEEAWSPDFIVAVSGTEHTIWEASFFKRDQISPYLDTCFFKRDQIRTYLVTFEQDWPPDCIVAVSGTEHTIWEASFFKRDQISPYLDTYFFKRDQISPYLDTYFFKRDQISPYLVTFEEDWPPDCIVAASGTEHTIWEASFFKRDQISPYLDTCFFKRDHIRTYLVTFEEDWPPDCIVAASGTEHTIWEASFFKRDQISPYLDTYFFKRDQIRTYLVKFEEDWPPDCIVAASGTEHTIWEASFFKRDQISPYLDTYFFKRDQIRTYLVKFEEDWPPDCIVTASGTEHTIWEVSFFKRDQISPYLDTYFFKRDQIRTYLVTFEEDWSPDGIVAASSTEHTILESNVFKRDQIIRYLDTCFFKRDQIRTTWSRLKKLAPQIVRSVPEAATTVLCTPDDGRDGRTIHVE